jgi:hypothetical protein
MLDYLERWHSAGVEVLAGKLVAHYAKGTAQLDELPAAANETWDIRITTSES